jgi:hypothetical protein
MLIIHDVKQKISPHDRSSVNSMWLHMSFYGKNIRARYLLSKFSKHQKEIKTAIISHNPLKTLNIWYTESYINTSLKLSYYNTKERQFNQWLKDYYYANN